MILDRRKRQQRKVQRDDSLEGYRVNTPISRPGSYRSGMSTRYHSAESVFSTTNRPVVNTTPLAPPILNRSTGEVTGGLDDDDIGETGCPWPEVLIVTGLEECDSLVQTQLIELVKLSARQHPERQAMLLIWVRPEAVGDTTPPWLVSLDPGKPID